MRGIISTSLFVLLAFIFCDACNTKNDYHYNVIDCKEPQIQALGDYILSKLKGERDLPTTNCHNNNMDYLRVAPFAPKDDKFDSKRLSASWVYKHKTTPDAVFLGPLDTMKALEKGETWNILVDRKLNIHRYLLRNSSDGEVHTAYLTEEDLMTKITNEQYWDHLDVMSCENFLFHLSKQFANQMVSVTVVDKQNSNDELRYIMLSSGIGGFYKSYNNGNEDEN